MHTTYHIRLFAWGLGSELRSSSLGTGSLPIEPFLICKCLNLVLQLCSLKYCVDPFGSLEWKLHINFRICHVLGKNIPFPCLSCWFYSWSSSMRQNFSFHWNASWFLLLCLIAHWYRNIRSLPPWYLLRTSSVVFLIHCDLPAIFPSIRFLCVLDRPPLLLGYQFQALMIRSVDLKSDRLILSSH